MWDKNSVKAYLAYIQKYPYPVKRAQLLIKKANLAPNLIIMDLAAGTGLVSQLIQGKYNQPVNLTLIDESQAMLKQAKLSLPLPATFVQSKIEELDKHFTANTFDRIICCAAFRNDIDNQIIGLLARLLSPQGLLAFNFAIKTRGFKNIQEISLFALIKELRRPEFKLNHDSLKLNLCQKYFQSVKISIHDFPRSSHDLLAWFSIPVFSQNIFGCQMNDELYEELERLLLPWQWLTTEKHFLLSKKGD